MPFFHPTKYPLWVFITVFSLWHSLSLAAPLSDQAISDAVEDEIAADQVVPINRIDVQTDEGVVALSGNVNHLLAKERATRIAQTVSGVRSVVNTIKVSPELRTDRAIRDDIKDALADNPATEAMELQVQVDGGGVTLAGTVDSWQEKQLANKIAKGIRGVKGVVDSIELAIESQRDDGEIAADVRQALQWNTRIDAGLIDVQVDDGKVHLEGMAGSAAEKAQAQSIAWVDGVVDVDVSGLDVGRWARDPALRGEPDNTDEGIVQGLTAVLTTDPRIDPDNVTIEADEGQVTLRGHVDNLQAKRTASWHARHQEGVVSVVNRLKVRPTEDRSDQAVAASVQNTLDRSPYLEPYEVMAGVDDGQVYLEGLVDSYFEKAEADRLASQVRGVEQVINHIEVGNVADPLVYDPYVDDYLLDDFQWYDYQPRLSREPDEQIREAIQRQFDRSPFVDSEEVDISVADGVATLTGTVDSWSEFRAAAQNAFEGGAVWVKNRLEVNP